MNTGGPAFPALPIQRHLDTGEILYQSEGVTMRDYFAAKAMQSVMSDVIKQLQKTYISQEKSDRLKKAACEACYGIADAMLKAREQ